MFHVGQRIVCIADYAGIDRKAISALGLTLPLKGFVFTVRDTSKAYGDLEQIILLGEIVNPVAKYNPEFEPFEPWFRARYFRPVDEKRIEVFRKMLQPKPEMVTFAADGRIICSITGTHKHD